MLKSLWWQRKNLGTPLRQCCVLGGHQGTEMWVGRAQKRRLWRRIWLPVDLVVWIRELYHLLHLTTVREWLGHTSLIPQTSFRFYVSGWERIHCRVSGEAEERVEHPTWETTDRQHFDRWNNSFISRRNKWATEKKGAVGKRVNFMGIYCDEEGYLSVINRSYMNLQSNTILC